MVFRLFDLTFPLLGFVVSVTEITMVKRAMLTPCCIPPSSPRKACLRGISSRPDQRKRYRNHPSPMQIYKNRSFDLAVTTIIIVISFVLSFIFIWDGISLLTPTLAWNSLYSQYWSIALGGFTVSTFQSIGIYRDEPTYLASVLFILFWDWVW